MAQPNLDIIKAQVAAAVAAGQPLTVGQRYYMGEPIMLGIPPGVATAGAQSPVVFKPVDPDNPYGQATSGGAGTVNTGTIHGWATPQEMFDRGYEFKNGQWTLRQGSTGIAATPPEDVGLPTSVGVLTNQNTQSGGPMAALQVSVPAAQGLSTTTGFLDLIRLTTGIGAGPDGALTPIREGITDLPRIIFGEVST